MEEVGVEKFIGVVTDNAAAMEKAKSLIKDKYAHITAYSCVSHTLNLLVGDIMKIESLKNLEVVCKQIVKEVTSSHINLATFNKIQVQKTGTSLTLKLPVKTRWGSILGCLESLIKTKRSLQMLMVMEDVTFTRNVKQHCLDNDVFWVRLEKTLVVLKPLVKWIILLEGDSNKCKLSQVVEAFNNLNEILTKEVSNLPVSKAEEQNILETFSKRYEMAVKPLHFAANLLDPHYFGEHLSNDQHVSAMEFINQFLCNFTYLKEKKDIILSELTLYLAKTGVWSRDFLWSSAKSVDSISWWQGLCKKTNLKDLAVAILGLPASSAATERSFSTYSFIHCAKRNRLTVERAGKLTFVAHNRKLCDRDSMYGIQVNKVEEEAAANVSGDDESEVDLIDISSSDGESEAEMTN